MDGLARIALAELRGAVHLIRTEGPLFWLRWFGPTPSAHKLRRAARRADRVTTWGPSDGELDALAARLAVQRKAARWN